MAIILSFALLLSSFTESTMANNLTEETIQYTDLELEQLLSDGYSVGGNTWDESVEESVEEIRRSDKDISQALKNASVPLIVESGGEEVSEKLDYLLKKLERQEKQASNSERKLLYNYTKTEIEQLLTNGYGVEDIFASYYLGNELNIEPIQVLFDQQEKSGKSWVQIINDVAHLENKSNKNMFEEVEVTDVRVIDTTTELNNDEISQENFNYSQESTLNALILNVNSVLNGLINQELINQTNKPQFADSEGSSEVIDPVTGKLVWKRTDISLPGRDNLNLDIGIMYDSNQAFPYMRHYGSPGNIKKYNYLISRYDLGAGWSFQFPSVQLSEGYLFYHNGNGAIYRVNFNSNDPVVNYTHLEGYQGKDLKFMQDSQNTFNNGEATSVYYLEYDDKKREYFASDGRLLGIKDRFGNTITFKHINRQTYDGQINKVISTITDSIGRVVKFTYGTSLPPDWNINGDGITVTVHDLNNVEKLRLEYLRILDPITFNGSPDGSVPKLGCTIDRIQNYTCFTHEWKSLYFSGNNKIQTSNSGRFSNAFLKEVTYPNSTTKYDYEKAVRNWGVSGFSDEYRIISRKDTVKKDDVPYGSYNNLNYSYDGDYTGYPVHYDPNNIPETYSFSTSVIIESNTAVNNLTQTSVFNGKTQQLYSETKAANQEKIILRNTSFHPTYKHLPTQIQKETYLLEDTIDTADILKQELQYTEWGGLLSETSMMLPIEFSTPTIKQLNTKTYSYEPNYRFLQSVSWYKDLTQNINTPVTVNYTYYSNGKIKSYTNAGNETTNYCYYTSSANNCTNTNQLLSGPITKIIESKALGGGKSLLQEITYSNASGYAYPSEIKQRITTRNQLGNATIKNIIKSYEYDFGTGLLILEKDGNNNRTEYTYDAVGRLLTKKSPTFTNLDGVQFDVIDEYSYYHAFLPNTIFANNNIDATRVESQRKYIKKSTLEEYYYYKSVKYYDGLGGLLFERKHGLGGSGNDQIQQYRYNDQRKIDYAIDPSNNQVYATYGYWGDLIETTDPFGHLIISEKKLKERKSIHYIVTTNNISAYRANPDQAHLKSKYIEQLFDHKGQLMSTTAFKTWPSVSQPVIERYEYDLIGNVTSYFDPNTVSDGGSSPTVKYEYDGLNRLISVTNAINQIAKYTYEPNGNIVEATIQEGTLGSPEVIFTKDYTENGKLDEKLDPAMSPDQFGYNELGLQVTKKDRNNSLFTFTYDELYEPIISSTVGSNLDSLEKQTTFGSSTPLAVRSRHYTNNVLSSTYTTVKDGLGRTTSNFTSDPSGFASYTTLLYNSLNQISSVSTGGLTTLFTTRYKYDKTRLKQVQTTGTHVSDNSDVSNVNYAYYRTGEIESISYPRLADNTILKTEYIYDALGRMTSVSNKKGSNLLSSTSYTYDNNGNIISSVQIQQNVNDLESYYTYDKLNRLVNVVRSDGSFASFAYDLRGNRITIESENSFLYTDTTYQYDLLNNLKSVNSNGTETSFSYAPSGLRYKKESEGQITKYRYDTKGSVIAELDGNNVPTAHYIRADRLLVKREYATSKDYYYLYNGHGDVIQIVDTSGNIVNSYTYDEWGNIRDSVEGTPNSFHYAGEIFDRETGLYYLRARYYDPVDGRFISEDSYEGQINNPLSLNLYTYVYNNPLNYIDPSGNVVETAIDIASIGWSAYDLYKNPSWANAGFLAWDVLAAFIPFAPGSYTAKGAKAAANGIDAAKSTKILMSAEEFKKAPVGVWAYGFSTRGFEIEKKLGGMANNFPTIDKYEVGPINGYASSISSIKSLNITAQKYQKENGLYNTLVGYVDKLENFGTTTWGMMEVKVNFLTKRTLELAIPPVEFTKQQADELQRAIDYATSKGISFIVHIVS